MVYIIFMVNLVHPAKADIELSNVLAALADPMRLRIIKGLMAKDSWLSCCKAAPCPDMAKSTLSNHFRVLRDAGLIRTTKKGVENLNTVRTADINDRFPNLLKTILKSAPDV